MTLSIFDIPHLKDDVTQYLSTLDLAHCALVSKEWFAQFSPCLWRTIDTSTVVHEHVLSALQRHQAHVHSIVTTDVNLLMDGGSMPTFPNLRSLNYAAIDQLSDDSYIFLFLPTEYSLDKLKLDVIGLMRDSSRVLTNILVSQPTLRQLDLTINSAWDPTSFPRVLQSCRNCHSLSLFLYHFRELDSRNQQYDDSYEVARGLIEQMQDLQIRELKVKFSITVQWRAILAPLLQRCPLIERLELHDLLDTATLKQISKGFREGSCPNLKHLYLLNVHKSEEEEEEDIASELIRALGHYQGNIGTEGDGTMTRRNGLESYEAYSLMKFTPRCIRGICELHAETLRILDLSLSHPILFPLFVTVVSSLSNLLSLKAVIWLGPNSLSFDETDMEVALRSSWSCLGLKTIALRTVAHHLFYSQWRVSLIEQCAGYLFGQIGKQAQLHDLRMEGDINYTRSMSDCLDRLSDLKQLRSFEFEYDNRFPFGAGEAEWMILNWPRLIQVLVNPTFPLRGGDSYRGARESLHTFETSLLARRPWIEISRLLERYYS